MTKSNSHHPEIHHGLHHVNGGHAEEQTRRMMDERSHAVLNDIGWAKPDHTVFKEKSPHEIVRKLFYVNQLNDRNLPGHHHTFACGPTSLTMALADHCARNPRTGALVVHQPPTERDRIGIITATGTMRAGEWLGGPARMAEFAKHFGLNAQAYSSNNLEILTRCLEQGKGAVVDGHCVRSGHAHYVYVAGRDAQGYIMGDPANPRVTHWSAAQLRAFMTGYGFTAVWNEHSAGGPRLVADAGGAGDLAAPLAVPRQRSRDLVARRDSGNNGSLFHPRKPLSFEPEVVQTSQFNAAVTPTEAAPPCQARAASINTSLPRVFSPPPRGANLGDSSSDQLPDDVSFDDSLSLQGSIDGIVNHLIESENDNGNLAFDQENGRLSLGLCNWSQDGNLPDLFETWREKSPETFSQIFGEDAPHLLDENWVRTHDFENDTPLLEKLNRALSEPSLRNAEIQMTRGSVGDSVNLAWSAGLRSDSSYAAVADACNRAGVGAVRKALQGNEIQNAIGQHQEDQAIGLMAARLSASRA